MNLNPMQYAVAIVAILASAFLVYGNHLDASVFASLATLCLGYVFGRQSVNGTNGNGAK